MTTANDVYEFVGTVIRCSQSAGFADIAQRLDDALHLGSTGLEVLGAIKMVFIEERPRIAMVADEARIDELVRFVDAAYGN